MTRIAIIRHGEAQAVHDRVIAGHRACSGLSPLGRRQAEALRDRLTATHELGDVAAMFASVLPRAIETAEIIAPALGGLTVKHDCGLCEVHPGDELDGMDLDEFEATHGSQPPASVFHSWGPGSESWAEFVARTGRGLLEVASAHRGQTVVIAAHGGVVDASFRVFGGLPIQRRMTYYTVNTSITEWQEQDDGDWLLLRYNDAAHLSVPEPVL